MLAATNASLKIKLTAGKGLFRGKVADPDTGKRISFGGAILQDQARAFGFFLGADESGMVSLEPN